MTKLRCLKEVTVTSVVDQLPALIGVVIGALGSYLVSSFITEITRAAFVLTQFEH